MVACLADVEYSKEVCCLAGVCEHSCSAAFHRAELCSYVVICRILKSCIEISGCLKIEKLTHIIRCRILPCRTLIDRYLTRFAVAGIVAPMKCNCVNCAHFYILLSY